MTLEGISIVIPYWRGEDYIDRCLVGIRNASVAPNEIIIVDNCPLGLSGSITESFADLPLTIIRSQPHIGYGRASNIGIHIALSKLSDVIVILNQDTIIQRDAIAQLAAVLREDTTLFAAAPLSTEYESDRLSQHTIEHYVAPHIDLINDLLQETVKSKYLVGFAGISGACIAFRAAHFAHTGRFDPLFFMYGEERELLQRASQQGLGIALVPLARVMHVHSLVSSKGARYSLPHRTRVKRGILIQEIKDPSRAALWGIVWCAQRCLRRVVWSTATGDIQRAVSECMAVITVVRDIKTVVRHRSLSKLHSDVLQQIARDCPALDLDVRV